MCSSPTERRRAARGRAGRLTGRGRPSLLPAAIAALLGGGCINGPLQNFRSSATDTKTGPDESQAVATLAELAAHDTVGPDLEYRVAEQLTYGTLDRSLGDLDSHDEVLSNRPSAELVTTSGPLRWSQRFEYHDTHSHYSLGEDNRLTRTDFLEKLEILPPDLPQFTGWINCRTVEDEIFVDQTTLEALLQVQQTLPKLDYRYTFQTRADDDLRSDVENDRIEHTVQATWHDEFVESRLNTSLSVFLNSRENDLSGSSADTPGLLVLPLQGLAAVDTTPQVATLAANPALIDSNDTLSAGPNIGGFAAGGELFWNLGVRVPHGSEVDVLHIATVDEVPAALVSQFSFAVWASDDNTFWTSVTAVTTFDYDPVFRRFRLTLPPIAQEYIKVVNTAAPPSAPAVLVSELRAFSPTISTDGTITTNDSARNASGSVSYRIADNLQVGYDLFVQGADTETDDVVTRDETRIDQGAWVNYSPHPKVDTNLRVSAQRTDDPVVLDEDFTTVTGLVSYHALETLDVNTNYTNTQRSLNGHSAQRNEGLQSIVSAQLLKPLRADLTVERNQQNDLANSRQIDHWIVGASVIADLTSKLALTLGFRDDEADVSGLGAALIPDPSEQRSEMIWLYHPTELLTAQLEFQWIDAYAGNGLEQRTRIDWIPFQDGQLDVQFDYNHLNTELVSGATIDRYRVLLRYTLTPRAFFEFDFSTLNPDVGPDTQLVALAFHFSS